jgi:uncharacterized repeat protein (TIGR03803 family)
MAGRFTQGDPMTHSKRHRGTSKFLFVMAIVAPFMLTASARGAYVVLHVFNSITDGTDPVSSLTLVGSSLYGTARTGGTNGDGTIFQMNANGTAFNVIHNFSSASTDGIGPLGALALSGSTFYGTTGQSQTGAGTVFTINTDGSGFAVIHAFTGSTTDGGGPQQSLVVSGSSLYGTTKGGGTSNFGTIFQMGTTGSSFSILRSFTGGTDGGGTASTPLLSGSTLYATNVNGSPNSGTLLRINTDGSGFSVLHTFVGGNNDGMFPHDSPLLAGSTLYGTTELAGSGGDGIIYKINSDGTGFTILHMFTGSITDGSVPFGSMILSGSVLYGLTEVGGANNDGTIYQINTDGSGFQLLHSFAGAADGEQPYGSLIQSGSTLYGMTSGNSDGIATIFSITVPEPACGQLLLAIAGLCMSRRRRRHHPAFPR